MAVKHVNRKGQTFYLHETKTKTGKPKYFFSMKGDGGLVESIPEGFGIYENPDAQVFLRKELPRLIADEEVAIVREGLRKYARDRRCMADVRERHIVVYYSERGDLYQKVLRFTLIDEDRRSFAAERWASSGRSMIGYPSPTAATSPSWSGVMVRISARSRSTSWGEIRADQIG